MIAWWEAAEETQTECWCGEGALHIGESPVTQDNPAASDHVLYSQLKILQLPFPSWTWQLEASSQLKDYAEKPAVQFGVHLILGFIIYLLLIPLC